MKRKPFQFNQTQIKAIADLLLELSKWLIVAVVFSTLFSSPTVQANAKENVFTALFLALLLIIFAIWLLREIKDK